MPEAMSDDATGMSAERLAEIRELAANAFTYDDYHRVIRAVPELLAEVERARGERLQGTDSLNQGWVAYPAAEAEAMEAELYRLRAELTELGTAEYEIGIQRPGEADAQQFCGFAESDVRARAEVEGGVYVERVCRRGKWRVPGV